MVPVRPRPHRPRRRRDGAGGAGRRSATSIPKAAARGRSARWARSRRWAGCGVRSTAPCSCACCRGSGSSGSTSRSAIGGLVASWWALADHDRPQHGARIDWVGAILLTVTLVSLNMALLGSAEIQSVNGLAGADRRRHRPALAVSRGARRRHRCSCWQQRTASHPLVDRRAVPRSHRAGRPVRQLRRRRRPRDRDGRRAAVHQLGRDRPRPRRP